MALGALVTERGRWIGIPKECGGVGEGVVRDSVGEGVVGGHVGEVGNGAKGGGARGVDDGVMGDGSAFRGSGAGSAMESSKMAPKGNGARSVDGGVVVCVGGFTVGM